MGFEGISNSEIANVLLHRKLAGSIHVETKTMHQILHDTSFRNSFLFMQATF